MIKRTPLKAFGPYRADEAPGRNSTSATSISEMPTILPRAKLPLAIPALSTPSISWISPVLCISPKPRPVAPLKIMLLAIRLTSRRSARPSKKVALGDCLRASWSTFSTDTGARIKLSSTREAETTTASERKLSSLRTTSRVVSASVISMVWVVKPTIDICRLNGGARSVSRIKIPSLSVDVPINLPSTTTLAPGSGPSFSSVTVPFTIVSAIVWPITINKNRKINKAL